MLLLKDNLIQFLKVQTLRDSPVVTERVMAELEPRALSAKCRERAFMAPSAHRVGSFDFLDSFVASEHRDLGQPCRSDPGLITGT